jgi:hypothetical protein
MTHIFDAAPKPLRAPVATLPNLWQPICSCGWRSPFDFVSVPDAREEWARHMVRVNA